MSTNSSDDDSARPRRQGASSRGDDRQRRPRRSDGDRPGFRRDERGSRGAYDDGGRGRERRSGSDRDRGPQGDRDRGREGDRGRPGFRRGPRSDDDRGPRRGPRRDDRFAEDRKRRDGRGERDRRDDRFGGDRRRRDDRRDDRRDGRREERRGAGRGGDFRRDDRSRGGARSGERRFGGRDERRDHRRDDRQGRRRDERRSGPKGDGRPPRRLPIPEDVTGEEVPRDVRQELMGLPKTLAEDVAKNLVMVGRLLEEDPEQAYQYSRVALRLASRVPAVREAAGFASYGVSRYAEALAEFRAARRMTGGVHLWPVMADCERGMGRPERALSMAGEPEVQQLDKAGQVEMRIVAAGARRDMGQADAAVVTLQSSELASKSVQPWTARLRYAYADALLEVGRADEARDWFARALEADQAGATDASDRLAELDGVEFLDALDEEAEETTATDAPERNPESPEEE